MTDPLRKAAEMAIEAIMDGDVKDKAAAVYALRQALAQPEQEPAAWINKDGWFRSPKDADAAFRASAFPLYAAQPKREWVGLTDEEKGWCAAPTYEETVTRTEAKLKEKNA